MSTLHVIKVPDVGEGIAEVELVEWHVAVGDRVAEDQVLATVMTDKASVEIPSAVAGRVAALGGDVGQTLAVGSELMRIELAAGAPVPRTAAPRAAAASPGLAAASPGPPASAATGSGRPATAAPAPAATPLPSRPAPSTPAAPAGAPTTNGSQAAGTPSPSTAPAGPDRPDRPIASPALRRRAWELGVDLAHVPGSGTGGRILQADLDAWLAVHPPAEAPPPELRSALVARLEARPGAPREDRHQIRVIGLRRRIAMRMQDAKRRIPHFAYVEEIDVTELESLRRALNEQHAATRGKLTLLPLLVRAMVLALAEHPQINAHFDDEAGVITQHGAVHMGVATQTRNGLMVPVLRHAEARSLWDMATEIARLADAARDGRATRDELSGSTLTISSLGALGGIVSTPVINAPEVAIVAVNRIVAKPVVRHGSVVVRQTMNLSSSFDHRVVDGADGARFIQDVRRLLEMPALLFVD